LPDWIDLTQEIKKVGSTYDILRRRYIEQLSKITNRNIIIYYSGWLQKFDPRLYYLSHHFNINDNDKNAFMTTVHELDRNKGLDLVLHTPGGDIAATESIIQYLRQMFQGNIRVIVPQIAMSGGTMIALACKSIVMGKQSSLGPIDPQINGVSAVGAIEEFLKAFDEIKKDPSKIPLWQSRIAQFPPAFIGDCYKAIEWATQMVGNFLNTGMFQTISSKQEKMQLINNIINEFANPTLTKSHSRHIPANRCQELGLKIEMMEDDQELQEAILTLHHITMLTLTDTPAFKIVENQNGKTYIQNLR